MAGIYIHIPFCKHRCAYCDFYSSTDIKYIDHYVDAVCTEIEMQYSYLKGEKVQTIYFGGGTPSMLLTKQIEKILNTIYKYFNVSDNCELTLEANPDDLSEKYLRWIKHAGVNRLSIGVQSTDNTYLTLMKRRHNQIQAIESVKFAQNVGFNNISIDLIYGLPRLYLNDWEKIIDSILKLNIQHISAYHLTIEPNTHFYKLKKKQKIVLPTEEESLDQFTLLMEKLEESGFLHYEISNFAKDGFISLHNTNYWLDVKYLGLGPSAHSYNLTSRQWNISNLQVYLSSILQGKLPNEVEILSKSEKYNDYVITSLRTMWGIDVEKLKINYGNFYFNYFLKKSKKYIDENILMKQNSNFSLTKKGMFISDLIMEKLLY